MNIHADIIDALNDALRVKFHSLAGYALDSRPYATRADLPLVTALERVAAEDKALARELARLIEALDGIPQSGVPDPLVSEIAYLRARRLVEICRDAKQTESRDDRRRLEATGPLVRRAGLTAAHRLLEKAAEGSQAHLNLLENALSETAPVPSEDSP
jgi:bacterioferritin (cytochrome b1)